MIIAIAAEEGGVGKSTLAVNLAVWRARQGRKVLLVDGDRIHASASAWVTRRGSLEQEPLVSGTMLGGDFTASQVKTIAVLFDDVIIDGRSGNDKSLLDSLLVADCCLAPMRLNRFDLLSMVNMGKLVEQAKAVNPGLKALAVISQAPTTGRGADAQEVRELIQKAVPGYRLLDQVIHTREAWNQSINMGLGVMELTSDESAEASEELEAVATEIWDSGVRRTNWRLKCSSLQWIWKRCLGWTHIRRSGSTSVFASLSRCTRSSSTWSATPWGPASIALPSKPWKRLSTRGWKSWASSDCLQLHRSCVSNA